MSDIYLSITETPTVVTLSQPVVSGVLSSNVTVTNVVSVNVVTMPAINVTAAAPSVTTVAGSVAVSNFPSVTTVAGTVALDANSLSALENVTVTVGAAVSVSNFPSTQTIAGTVTANAGQGFSDAVYSGLLTWQDVEGGFVIESLPTISGTVTANVPLVDATLASGVTQGVPVYLAGGRDGVVIDEINYINYIPPISGTVTVGNSVTIGSCVTHGVRLQDGSGNNLTSTSIGGLQRLNVSLASAATPGGSLPSFVNVYGGTDGSAVRTISVDSTGRQNTNAQFPRVTFIDGSGTVATANTAITVFASSSTRSYLLVQVTTGSAFVNVGATATTVNGLSLTAGQGYSWETTIPQGIVSLISTTTNSRYVAKEA